MATPKRKTSHARTSQRKANWLKALSVPETASCPHCGETVISHRACPACGYYRGRQVVKIDTEKTAG